MKAYTLGVDRPSAASRRRTIRYIAAALAAATSALYFLIGVGAVKVVDVATKDAPDMLTFGGSAGAAFVLGALLLLATDRRPLWLLGAAFQVGVIVMYIAIAPQRTPSYEIWGISIKVCQALLLVALVYLVIRPPVRDDRVPMARLQ